MSFTTNEAIVMMHKHEATNLRLMADHFEKWDYSMKQIVEYMREMADIHEAQIIVVELRDKL